MRVVSLQTARNGGSGVKRKNNFEVDGKPLFLHNLENLNKSTHELSNSLNSSFSLKFPLNIFLLEKFSFQ